MSATALGPGALVGGDFRIVRLLASGGMGAVYIAEQRSTGSMRALKVLHARFAGDLRTRERFVDEAKASVRTTTATLHDVPLGCTHTVPSEHTRGAWDGRCGGA